MWSEETKKDMRRQQKRRKRRENIRLDEDISREQAEEIACRAEYFADLKEDR